MTCAVTGKRAWRQGGGKANTANGGEIGSISGPKWHQRRSLLFFFFFENLLQSLCLFFFRIQQLNFPKLALMYQKSCYQITATNAAEDSQTRQCSPSFTACFLHCGWMVKYHKKLFSQFYLGLSWAKARLLAEYAVSCLNMALPLAKPKIKTF